MTTIRCWCQFCPFVLPTYTIFLHWRRSSTLKKMLPTSKFRYQHLKIVNNIKSPILRCHQYHCHHLQFGPMEKRRVLVSSGLCLGDPKLGCIKSDQIVWPLNQTVIQLAQTPFVTSVFRTRVPRSHGFLRNRFSVQVLFSAFIR